MMPANTTIWGMVLAQAESRGGSAAALLGVDRVPLRHDRLVAEVGEVVRGG